MRLLGPPNIRKLKTKKDVDALTRALTYKKDAEVREAAARALGDLSDDLIQTVGNIWAAEDLRAAAVARLASIGEPALKPLLAKLKTREILVRIDALSALEKMAGKIPEANQTFYLNAIDRRDRELEQISREIVPLTQLLNEAAAWAAKHEYPLYEEYPQYAAVQAIGKRIHRMAGHSGMWAAYYPVLETHRGLASFLDGMWHGIGTWRR